MYVGPEDYLYTTMNWIDAEEDDDGSEAGGERADWTDDANFEHSLGDSLWYDSLWYNTLCRTLVRSC
jgi:hypothetical protein